MVPVDMTDAELAKENAALRAALDHNSSFSAPDLCGLLVERMAGVAQSAGRTKEVAVGDD